jgi:formylglycine-generating enzyme required for sulfatase activity
MFQVAIPNSDSLCRKRCSPCEAFTQNYRHEACSERKAVAPVNVDAFMPNAKGLYNIQGNVAEMTATKGIAKGGSFRHYAIESFRDAKQHYNGPADWLGFRIAVTAVEARY